MEKITIEKAPITIVEFNKRDGSGKGQLTQFAARKADGTLMAVCQVFGDRKALLEGLMTEGKEIECEPAWNQERNRWDVKLPQSLTGDAPRGKWGGQRQWTPNGYKGKPIPQDVWWKITSAAMQSAVDAIMAAIPPASTTGVSEGTVPVAAIIAEARSLTAQFWMELEKNVCVVPGYEAPAPAATTEQPAAAHGEQKPATQSEQKPAGNGHPGRPFAVKVGPDTLHTAGVTADTLVRLWGVMEAYSKANGGREAAMKMMSELTGKGDSKDLPEAEAVQLIKSLQGMMNQQPATEGTPF